MGRRALFIRLGLGSLGRAGGEGAILLGPFGRWFAAARFAHCGGTTFLRLAPLERCTARAQSEAPHLVVELFLRLGVGRVGLLLETLPLIDEALHVVARPLQFVEQFLIRLVLGQLILQVLDRQIGRLLAVLEVRIILATIRSRWFGRTIRFSLRAGGPAATRGAAGAEIAALLLIAAAATPLGRLHPLLPGVRRARLSARLLTAIALLLLITGLLIALIAGGFLLVAVGLLVLARLAAARVAPLVIAPLSLVRAFALLTARGSALCTRAGLLIARLIALRALALLIGFSAPFVGGGVLAGGAGSLAVGFLAAPLSSATVAIARFAVAAIGLALRVGR